ncbi:MAG TPA: IPT/TIG domain-containing protein, partial [Longimicrobiales bacterium]|nr:IPT/TIG domain-containing protein [Longimicrobiales bacterium]
TGMKSGKLLKVWLIGLCLSAACGTSDGGTGPAATTYNLAIQSGDAQFGTKSGALVEPLQVVLSDAVTKSPVSGVVVTWSIVEGTGASLSTTTSSTNSAGVASTLLTLGPVAGTYRVQATTAKIVGAAPRFTAHAVDVPSIASISQVSARAGDTVTIIGSNFSMTIDDNIVLFGGFRGKTVSATATQLRAVVPLCVPTRAVGVQALLGAVSSNTVSLSVSGSTASALSMLRGEVRVFTDPNELACFRLPGGILGMSMLLVPQNYSEVVGSVTNIQVTGLTGSTTAASFAAPITLLQPMLDVASAWEMHLRRNEQQMSRGPVASLRPNPSTIAAACAGAVGDRCTFQVLDKDNKFQTVTAEIKVLTAHSIIAQDITAPANGLTAADFTSLGNVFEDPIYSTDIATFGNVSDLDHNNRVVILLTPLVNALTDKGTSGFIAGFFYGCDLLTKAACSGSNEGEIFYALTADPTGVFSDARSRTGVLASLPPVIAHEFQHMINFGLRGNSTDALWLSEGMAHHAEDVVADVFEQRGDFANASSFRAQNTLRANRFLRTTTATSLVGEDEVGTLEQRGAAWLFVKYLAVQYGNAILKQLSSSKLSSVTNVTTQAAKSWTSLLSDWSIAIWADDAPELAGATLKKEHTFPGINLRQRLANNDGSYPLKPTTYAFEDFVFKATLPASAQAYLQATATGGAPKQLNLSYTGSLGGAFAINAAPQLSILRVQ